VKKLGNIKSKRERGFTLVEIIVVFAIIALLSTYMMGSSFIAARQRARDAERKENLRKLATALEQYMNDHGTYPAADGNGRMMACGASYTLACDWGGPMGSSSETLYMAKLPEDRTTGRNFFYRTQESDLAWQLYAKLERDDDKDVDNNGDGTYVPADDDFAGTNCGVGACNYGISSGNTTP